LAKFSPYADAADTTTVIGTLSRQWLMGRRHAPHAAQSNKRLLGDFAQPCVTALARIAPVALVQSEGNGQLKKPNAALEKQNHARVRCSLH
jgi:hypothetical protein